MNRKLVKYRFINLDVRLPPSIIEGPQDKIYASGESYKLECAAVGTPPPEFRWYKDGELVESWPPNAVPDLSETEDGTFSGSMMFTELYQLDAGTFQCFL